MRLAGVALILIGSFMVPMNATLIIIGVVLLVASL